MATKKIRTLSVQGISINVVAQEQNDYISLTDIAKKNDGPNLIENWLRNQSTIEFLQVWEQINNPNFNSVQLDGIKTKIAASGAKRLRLSVKQWIEKTNAIGLIAKAGRYGGTYAHKDIAFEFAMWLSPEFKLYLIKDWERLKKEELAKQKSLEWDYSRFLAKVNYRIHTDAVKTLIPPDLPKYQISYIFATEADLLNVALFGKTAKQWRTENPNKDGNMRDYATIEQLHVLTNLEAYNAILIDKGIEQLQRLQELRKTAITQLQIMLNNPTIKKLK